MSGALSIHHGDFGRAALYDLDRPMVTHAHREGHLIFYLDGARGEFTVNESRAALDEAAGVAVSPWEPHSFATTEPGACLNLVIYIKPMWFLETSRSAEFSLSFGRPQIERTPQVEAAVRRLAGLLMEAGYSDLFDGYLFELTSLCFEQSWQSAACENITTAWRGRFSDYRVRRSMRVMQERFCEEVEMDWLAKEAGLSRPHFFKLFRKQLGITPSTYLNMLRTEHAIEDLTESEKSVTEIGFDLGFSSQASFTRFFCANVGVPPSDYRRVAHIG